MHVKTDLPNPHIQKRYLPIRSLLPQTGLVQLQDKIVVRFALTIYPYSLGEQVSKTLIFLKVIIEPTACLSHPHTFSLEIKPKNAIFVN